MVFMSIFNFLEPSVTIIAQAIPMFRVLVVNAKKSNATGARITSASRAAAGIKSHLASQQRRWNSRVLSDNDTHHHKDEPDEALLNVVRVDRTVRVESTLASTGSGTSVVMEDKLYDGALRQY